MKGVLKNSTGSQVGLTIALIVFMFYLPYSTTPVPNLNNATGEYRYNENDKVPPSYVSNELAGLGIILVVMLFLSSRVTGLAKELLSERQFKEIVTREIRKKQTIPLPDNSYEIKNWRFKVDPNIIPKYITEKGERTLFQYILQLTLTDSNENDYYYLVTGNPITGLIDGIVQTEDKLDYADKCPKCGRFPDEKIILPEEFKTLKDIKILTQG